MLFETNGSRRELFVLTVSVFRSASCLCDLPRFNAYDHEINLADFADVIAGLRGKDDEVSQGTFDD